MAKHVTRTCFVFSLILICAIYGKAFSFDEKDSAAILQTLKNFHAAQKAKNQSEWKKFWHDNSPVANGREKSFAEGYWEGEPEKLVSIAIEKGWDKTYASAEVALTGGALRHVGLIRDASGWKIWHESSLEAFRTAQIVVAANKDAVEPSLSKINDGQLASALNWLGYGFYEKREFEKAFTLFAAAQKMADPLDAAARVSAQIFGGHALLEQGKYRAALAAYKNALKMASAANFETGTIRALSGIGNAANYLGEYFEARNAQERRLDLLRKTGSATRIAVTLKNLGNTYFYLGQFDKALGAYEESERLGFQDTGLMLNMGAVLAELGKFPEAEKKLQNGLLMARDGNNSADIGRALNGLGQVAFRRSQYKEAVSFFQQSLKEGVDLKGGEQAKIQLNQSYGLFKLQDYAAAASLTENAIRTARESESPEPVWFGQYLLGRIQRAQNKPKQAQQTFEQSVGFIEDWVKKNGNTDGLESFFQDKVEPYRELVGLLVADEKNARALEYAELSKAKTLLGATKGVNQVSESPDAFSLAQTADLLKDKETVLLEYVVAEDATFIFVITKTADAAAPQLTVKKIPYGRAALETSIGSLRNKLSAENYDFADQSSELYERLIRPVEDKILNRKNLIIVPDSVIWGLPFQALKMRSEEFLWERFSITYARSLTSLLRAAKRQNTTSARLKPTLLGIAGSAAPQTSELIPFAEESVTEIVPFYGRPQSRIFTGGAATEEQIKAVIADYDIVHFATHGYLDNQSPMSSYLQLANGDVSENGKLEANEIQDLRLKADLVVLAGCETGRGKLFDGEGIVGLAWALEKAGVLTLIVSHWKVRDRNTKELMTEFHHLWRESAGKGAPLSVSEALRQAALAIRKRRPHPVYWAGFVVMGSGF